MADKKITALTDLGTALASTDLFHIVQDPTGTPINKKVSTSNVFNNIPTYMAFKGQQLIIASGVSQALTTTNAISNVDATLAVQPVTLADGSDGQVKTIINVSTSGTFIVTITPTNKRGFNTIVLNAPGETVTLLFKTAKWNIICGFGYTTT